MGEGKILLIMLLALIVLGPERLPKLAADIGRWVGRARALARQLTTQLDQEVRLEEIMRDQRARNATSPAPPEPVPAADTTHRDAHGSGELADAHAAAPMAAPAATVADTPPPAAAAVTEPRAAGPHEPEERGTPVPGPAPIASTDAR